jgi:transcriptional regulator with XRE-family HTH domain
MVMRELSEFEDYRDILGEAYAVLKAKNPKISLSRIAKKVSLDRSFLSMVLKKKRHLDIRRLGKIAEAFHVPENRMDYFYISYMNSQLGKVDQFNILTSIVSAYRYSVKRNATAVSPADLQNMLKDQMDNGGDLSFFLMGLADFPDFVPDTEWVKKQLINKEVDAEEIRKSLDFLLKKGFILQDAVTKKWRSSSVDFSGNPFETNLGIPSIFPYFKGLGDFLRNPGIYRPFQVFGMAYSFDEEAIRELNKDVDALYAKAKALSDKVSRPTHLVSLGSWLYSVARLN